jgi:hypothetical protein
MSTEETEVAQRGTEKGKGKNKGEIRGSLHCAADGETVRRFGRDDGCLWGVGGRTAVGLGRKVRAVEVRGVLRGPSAALRMTGLWGVGGRDAVRRRPGLRGCHPLVEQGELSVGCPDWRGMMVENLGITKIYEVLVALA